MGIGKVSDQGLQEVATLGDVRGSRRLTPLTLANVKIDEFEFNSDHAAKRLPSRRWARAAKHPDEQELIPTGLRARLIRTFQTNLLHPSEQSGGTHS